jgi:carboxymethylenebutenolidase
MKRRDLLIVSAGIAITPAVLATGTQMAKAQSVKGETVTLAKDLQGYYVRPQGKGPFPAVMVFMEAFGLNQNIKNACDRLAKSGYAALAPDFYHGDVYEYSDIQNAIAKLKSLNEETAMAEVGEGLKFLAQRQEVAANKVGVMGFCMGGRLTFLANAAHANSFQAAASFYGGGIAPKQDSFGRKPLLDRVEAMQAPIMLVYGAEDEMIPPDEHGRIAQALSAAKKRYILTVFPNAGHGFLSDRRDSYAPEAAREAWEMTMNFFKQNLA